MTKVKKGDKISVHYTGTLSNGEQFDSSREREPLRFEVGAGRLIAGFEDAVVGMEVNEKKTIVIPAAQGYGERDDRNIIVMPKENFPKDLELQVGIQLELQDEHGNVFPVVITAIGENDVTLDANHPLAGEDLTFELEVMEIGVELEEHHHHEHDHEH